MSTFLSHSFYYNKYSPRTLFLDTHHKVTKSFTSLSQKQSFLFYFCQKLLLFHMLLCFLSARRQGSSPLQEIQCRRRVICNKWDFSGRVDKWKFALCFISLWVRKHGTRKHPRAEVCCVCCGYHVRTTSSEMLHWIYNLSI